MQRDHDGARASMLERGVRVLNAFRPDGGTLTLTVLVERTALPKPTVYRLAESLVTLGLLERRPRGYSPGLALFELGELVPATANLRQVALPYMQDLFEVTRATVHLGIRDEFEVVYAEKFRGHRGVDVPSRVGGRLPLNSTGVGKALLAFAPDEVVTEVLERPLRGLTARSITDPVRLAAELAGIRERGIAYEHGEASPGIACIAAPVLVGGQAVAALSLAMPVRRINAAGMAPALRTAALALARTLSRAAGP